MIMQHPGRRQACFEQKQLLTRLQRCPQRTNASAQLHTVPASLLLCFEEFTWIEKILRIKSPLDRHMRLMHRRRNRLTPPSFFS